MMTKYRLLNLEAHILTINVMYILHNITLQFILLLFKSKAIRKTIPIDIHIKAHNKYINEIEVD